MQSFFNNISIYYKDDRGQLRSHSVPMFYGRSEKAIISNNLQNDSILKGNTHVLPCGYITLDAMNRDDSRVTNRNRITYNDTKNPNATFQYSYNSVPYDFIFSIRINCRGINESAQIIEQIAPMFNPTLNLDCWDSLYKDAPTRIAITLDAIDADAMDYDEDSANVYTVSLSCTLKGWLYQPLLIGDHIDNVFLNFALDKQQDNYMSLKDLEVIKPTDNLKLSIIDLSRAYDPNSKQDIITANIQYDPKLIISYEWTVINGKLIKQEGSTAYVKSDTDYVVQLKIADQFNNFETIIQKFKAEVYV